MPGRRHNIPFKPTKVLWLPHCGMMVVLMNVFMVGMVKLSFEVVIGAENR